MTLDEFLRLLSSLNREWVLRGTAVRTRGDSLCPLQVLIRDAQSTLLPWECGKVLGMSRADSQAVFRASDNVIDPALSQIHESDHRLRGRILKACRLKETADGPLRVTRS